MIGYGSESAGSGVCVRVGIDSDVPDVGSEVALPL